MKQLTYLCCQSFDTASILGFLQETWDKDRIPEQCRKYWVDLDDNQREAVTALGFHKESWDKYKESYDDDDEEDGNRYLLYFYYLCYALGSIFYLQLSLICFWWSRQTRGRVPERVLAEDDDDIWQDWSEENDAGDIIESREVYWVQSERCNMLGAFAFAVMGLIELYMDGKCNTFRDLMIPLGGLIGMINALGIGHSRMSALSVTCYLLSCAKCNIFFAGAAIECIVEYGYLAGYDGDWLMFLDMAAALLWLYCAVKGAAAELFGISFIRLFHLRLDSLLKTERTAASSSLCCSPKSNVAQKRE